MQNVYRAGTRSILARPRLPPLLLRSWYRLFCKLMVLKVGNGLNLCLVFGGPDRRHGHHHLHATDHLASPPPDSRNFNRSASLSWSRPPLPLTPEQPGPLLQEALDPG